MAHFSRSGNYSRSASSRRKKTVAVISAAFVLSSVGFASVASAAESKFKPKPPASERHKKAELHYQVLKNKSLDGTITEAEQKELDARDTERFTAAKDRIDLNATIVSDDPKTGIYKSSDQLAWEKANKEGKAKGQDPSRRISPYDGLTEDERSRAIDELRLKGYPNLTGDEENKDAYYANDEEEKLITSGRRASLPADYDYGRNERVPMDEVVENGGQKPEDTTDTTNTGNTSSGGATTVRRSS